jgi:hypothetical protein
MKAKIKELGENHGQASAVTTLKAYNTSEEEILQERCLNCGDERHTTNECERTTDNSEEIQQIALEDTETLTT